MNAARGSSTSEPVLVELCSDGFVRVYGRKSIHALVVNRPHASTSKAGILVDELLDEVLPFSHKQIFYPSAIRATGLLRKLTAERLRDILDDVRLIQCFRDPKLQAQTRQILLRAIGGGR